MKLCDLETHSPTEYGCYTLTIGSVSYVVEMEVAEEVWKSTIFSVENQPVLLTHLAFAMSAIRRLREQMEKAIESFLKHLGTYLPSSIILFRKIGTFSQKTTMNLSAMN